MPFLLSFHRIHVDAAILGDKALFLVDLELRGKREDVNDVACVIPSRATKEHDRLMRTENPLDTSKKLYGSSLSSTVSVAGQSANSVRK